MREIFRRASAAAVLDLQASGSQGQNYRIGRCRFTGGKLGTRAGGHKPHQWKELPSGAFNRGVYRAPSASVFGTGVAASDWHGGAEDY